MIPSPRLLGPPHLERIGLILTATGIASVAAVSFAMDPRSPIVVAVGFLLALALIALAAGRQSVRPLYLVAFAAFAVAYAGLGLARDGAGAALALYVVFAGLAVAVTTRAYRPLTVGTFALWTPAVRFFGPYPFDTSFPLPVAAAAVLSLATTVVLLVLRDAVTPVERVRRVALALLSLACVAAVVDRHASVASPGILAPDDLLAIAASVLLPVLAVLRLRGAMRDAIAIGLALAIYAAAGAALVIGQGYQVDTIVAQHRATELFLQGADPYRVTDVIASLRDRGLDPALGTHLEDGSQLHAYTYPALSFLIPAPFLALGLTDLRLVYLGEILLLIVVLLRPVGAVWRPLAAAVLVGSTVIMRQNIAAGVDPAYALFLALAFVAIRQRTLSPICIGLAVACRQPAWIFVPFYVLQIWRRDGRTEALRRTAILAAAAALPNLPFLLGAPGAFLGGVTAPMLQPLEPYGVGLVSFGLAGILPLWPRAAYGLLSALVLGGLLLLLVRCRRALPQALVVFPSLVLWFSWRSAENYFGFAGIFALIGDETMQADAEPAAPGLNGA